MDTKNENGADAMNSTQETPSNEVIVSPEKAEASKGIVSHELGHAVVAWAQGIPLMKVELSIEGGKQSGSTVFNSFENVTPRMHGVCLTAGLAGELILLGEDYVRSSGFRGLRTDSAWLNRLGFTTQEQKADLLAEALAILHKNMAVYKKWAAALEAAMIQATQNGVNTIEITRDTMKDLGILDFSSEIKQ